jgi:hypothetical protein
MVDVSPLLDEAEGSPRERSGEDGAVLDLYERLMLAIFGVKVRGRMIGPIHVDHDAVKG